MENITYPMTEDRNKSSYGNFTDINILPDNNIVNVAFMVVSSVLFCFGLVGNSATLVIIRLRTEFHTATYTVVGLLAFVDLIAVCLRGTVLVHAFNTFQQNWRLELSLDMICVLLTATFISLVCSSIHVVLLARLRYKLLTFPIQGMSIMPRHMVYQSILAWSISGMFGIPYGFSFSLDEFHQYICEIIINAVLCLCTILPIVTFHILKVRNLRGGITSKTGTMRSMNKIVVAICLVQILSTTSSTTGIIIFFCVGHSVYTLWTVAILFLINHVMNPILFFYFTTFRRLLHSTKQNRIHRNEQCDTRV